MHILDHVIRRAGLQSCAAEYADLLRNEGYDDVRTIAGMQRDDVEACGIACRAHVRALLEVVGQLKCAFLIDICCEAALTTTCTPLRAFLDERLEHECAAVRSVTARRSARLAPRSGGPPLTIFILSERFLSDPLCCRQLASLGADASNNRRFVVVRVGDLGAKTRDVLVDNAAAEWIRDKPTAEVDAIRLLFTSPFIDLCGATVLPRWSMEAVWTAMDLFHDGGQRLDAGASVGSASQQLDASPFDAVNALLTEVADAFPPPASPKPLPSSLSLASMLAHFAPGVEPLRPPPPPPSPPPSPPPPPAKRQRVATAAAAVAATTAAPASLVDLIASIDSLPVLPCTGVSPSAAALAALYKKHADAPDARERALLSQHCFALGAPAEVVRALEFNVADALVAKFGCGVLGFLALVDDAQRPALARACFASLAAVLDAHVDDAGVVFQCVAAMANLARPPATDAATAEGAAAVLVRALARALAVHSDDTEIACASFRVLALMAQSPEACLSGLGACVDACCAFLASTAVGPAAGARGKSPKHADCVQAALEFAHNASATPSGGALARVDWAHVLDCIDAQPALVLHVVAAAWNLRLPARVLVDKLLAVPLLLASNGDVLACALGWLAASAPDGAQVLRDRFDAVADSILAAGVHARVAEWACVALGACGAHQTARAVELVELLAAEHAGRDAAVFRESQTALTRLVGDAPPATATAMALLPAVLKRPVHAGNLAAVCCALVRAPTATARLVPSDALNAVSALLSPPRELAGREHDDVERVLCALVAAAAHWRPALIRDVPTAEVVACVVAAAAGARPQQPRTATLRLCAWLLCKQVHESPSPARFAAVVPALPCLLRVSSGATLALTLAACSRVAATAELADAFESEGLVDLFARTNEAASELVAMAAGTEFAGLPREIGVRMRVGFPLGNPDVPAEQRRALAAALAALRQPDGDARASLVTLAHSRALFARRPAQLDDVLAGALLGTEDEAVMALVWVNVAAWALRLDDGGRRDDVVDDDDDDDKGDALRAVIAFALPRGRRAVQSALRFVLAAQRMAPRSADAALLFALEQHARAEWAADELGALLNGLLASDGGDDAAAAAVAVRAVDALCDVVVGAPANVRETAMDAGERALLAARGADQSTAVAFAFLKLSARCEMFRAEAAERIAEANWANESLCRVVCELSGLLLDAPGSVLVARVFRHWLDVADTSRVTNAALGALELIAVRLGGVEDECAAVLVEALCTHASDVRCEGAAAFLERAMYAHPDAQGAVRPLENGIAQAAVDAFVATPTQARLGLLASALPRVQGALDCAGLADALDRLDDDRSAAALQSKALVREVLRRWSPAALALVLDTPAVAAAAVSSIHGLADMPANTLLEAWRRFHLDADVALACLLALQRCAEAGDASELLARGCVFDIVRAATALPQIEAVQLAGLQAVRALAPMFAGALVADVLADSARGSGFASVTRLALDWLLRRDAAPLIGDARLLATLSAVVQVHADDEGLLASCLEALQRSLPRRSGNGGNALAPALVGIVRSTERSVGVVRAATDVLAMLDGAREQEALVDSGACAALVAALQRDAALHASCLRALAGLCTRHRQALLDAGVVEGLVVCLDAAPHAREDAGDDVERLAAALAEGLLALQGAALERTLVHGAPRHLGGPITAAALLGAIGRVLPDSPSSASALGAVLARVGGAGLCEPVLGDPVALDELLRLHDAGVDGALRFVAACLVDPRPAVAQAFVGHVMCVRLVGAMATEPAAVTRALLGLARCDVAEELHALGALDACRQLGGGNGGAAELLAHLEPKPVTTPDAVRPPLKPVVPAAAVALSAETAAASSPMPPSPVSRVPVAARSPAAHDRVADAPAAKAAAEPVKEEEVEEDDGTCGLCGQCEHDETRCPQR